MKQDAPPVVTEVTLSIDVAGKKIDPDVERVTLYQHPDATHPPPPRLAVQWSLVAKGTTPLPADWTTEVDFEIPAGQTDRGPFPPSGPNRGRYSVTASRPARTRDKDKSSGRWKYDLVLKDGTGKELDRVDPMIEIVN